MKLLHTIKHLRRQQGISQLDMADQLCMGRSSYSKLESGSTLMPYNQLVRIAAILRVPVYTLIQEDGGLFVHSVYDKFSLLLHTAYYRLSCQQFSALPYEQLNFEQLTPLGGRIYDFGPKKAFAQLVEDLGMQVLFEEKLIRDAEWLARWEEYQEDRKNHHLAQPIDMDEQEYFIVFMILLTQPDGTSRLVQLAERDFPQGADDNEALALVVTRTGAQSAQILAVTEEGYVPETEIVTCA